jgi:hypothetical protein
MSSTLNDREGWCYVTTMTILNFLFALLAVAGVTVVIRLGYVVAGGAHEQRPAVEDLAIAPQELERAA